MTRRRHHIAVLALLLLVPAGRAQSVIELRQSAVLERGKPVTIADVAALTGPEATELGGIVLAASLADLDGPPGRGGSPWVQVSAGAVRAALESSADVNWGRVSLRGGRVLVRERADTGSLDEAAAEEVEEERTGGAPEGPTVRAHAEAVIARTLRVGQESLRFSWSDGDAALLNESTLGRTVQTRPMGGSDRVPLSIAVYEEDRVVVRGTVRVGVEIRRTVVRAARAVRRGETIAADQIAERVEWLPANARPAAAAEVAGSVARSHLAPGELVETNDVEPAVAVRRGRRLMVHSVSSTVVLQNPARALEDGAVGEVIRVRLLPSGPEVEARVSGAGIAVISVGGEPAGGEAGR